MEIRNIKTSAKKLFKLLLSQQSNTTWTASCLFVKDGSIEMHSETATKKEDAYQNSVNWVLKHLDKNAAIDPL